MTITVDDVLMLQEWKEKIDEMDNIDMLEEVIKQSRDLIKGDFEMARYIILFDRFLYRMKVRQMINDTEMEVKQRELRENVEYDVIKLLRAVKS